jgi:alpha-ribazole phosphatase/probable phosphoglycerate mutase
MSYTILLVRHAQSAFQGRFCGSSDPPLSCKGEEDARQLAAKLSTARINRIYCSPLRRAVATAEAIAGVSALSPLTPVEGLREIDFGSWEGLTWREIELRDPGYAKRWMEQFPTLPAPGGENFEAFQQRVENTFLQIRLEIEHSPVGITAVVAHGGVLAVLLAAFLGHPFRAMPLPPTSAVFEVELRNVDTSSNSTPEEFAPD